MTNVEFSMWGTEEGQITQSGSINYGPYSEEIHREYEDWNDETN